MPSDSPSSAPSLMPSDSPSSVPSLMPSDSPSSVPSLMPSDSPSSVPSLFSSEHPSSVPSLTPSDSPSSVPSLMPSDSPSSVPSLMPSDSPSSVPSLMPSDTPSLVPSESPSYVPSLEPSLSPSVFPSLLPSLSPSHLPTVLSSTVPTLVPSSEPSNGPTLHPTTLMQPWIVGPTSFTVESDEFSVENNLLTMSNAVGSKGINNVIVELFDYGCINKQENNNSTNAVKVFSEVRSLSSNVFNYSLNVAVENMGSDTGGFIFSNGDGTGDLKFCTRVSTWENSIQVAFHETNFILSYDMSDNTFSLLNVQVGPNGVDSFITRVIDDFSLAACQCSNFQCITTPESIKPDELLVLCLRPDHPDGLEDIVHISNFNLNLFAGSGDRYVEYNPVWFNTDGYGHNILTDVVEQGDIIMITTPVVAQFYIQGHASISVSGSAFLQFDTSKSEREPSFADYSLELGLEVAQGEGCFKSLIRKIQKLFKFDSLPEVNLPEVNLPEVNLPEVNLPGGGILPEVGLPGGDILPGGGDILPGGGDILPGGGLSDISVIPENINENIVDAVDEIKEATNNAMDQVKEATNNAMDEVKDATDNAVDNAVGSVLNFFGKLRFR